MKEIKRLSDIASESKKLTILIGSGVNTHSVGGKKSILTSWSRLLDAVFQKKSNVSSQNYILDFERRLVDKTSEQDDKAASKIQDVLLKGICESIQKEQVKPIYSKDYPTYLFNKEIVTNVVSLNFDLIPELLMRGGKTQKLGKKHESLSKYNSLNICRFREIDGIRYWHPHGDVESKKSLVLGMSQYIENVSYLEHMRRNHKKSERSANNEIGLANSWYEALVDNPVLILGASLSDNELDIWGALINRERNFAKGINRSEYRPPVFIMWSEGRDKKAFNKPDWVKPLFPVHLSYDEQWIRLKKLFLEHGKH